MFNREIEITEENVHILFANAIIENLRYGIISLDAIFKGEVPDGFFGEKHTFYFFHIQSVLTAQGNIWNMLFKPWGGQYQISRQRVIILRDVFGIDMKRYLLLQNKDFRNTNEHFDERYEKLLIKNTRLGDLNIIDGETDAKTRDSILNLPHLRTLDTINRQYISYNKRGEKIVLDLQELRREMYSLLMELCTHDIRK